MSEPKQVSANGRVFYVLPPGVKLPGKMDEEFVLVENSAEAAVVDRCLNRWEARRVKRRRFAHLREHGTVDEVLMPDTREALQGFARGPLGRLLARALKKAGGES